MPTGTITLTATATAVATATPLVRDVLISPPYPNPVSGSGPNALSFQVQAPGGSSVEWGVFTVSFRKIWDSSQSIPGNSTTLAWNLNDFAGTPVSNGLYYLRVRVTGPVKATKILKVIVAR
jgi:hypothetical protein